MIKSVILVCFVTLLLHQIGGDCKFEAPAKTDDIHVSYFKQIVDHRAKNPRYWDQKYFANEEFRNESDSPIFLKLGGDSALGLNWMKSGAWYVWAQKYGAIMFQLEHRFYGESHPTSDTSVKNLELLTSRQALRDVAYFIKQMTTNYNFTKANKWILFGGGYAGNLAAWARLKFPHLVFGSISSSAPLQAKVDFYEYNDVVRDSLNYFSPGCADHVTKSIHSIQEMFKSERGLAELQEKMPGCSDFAGKFSKEMYFYEITSSTSDAAQYNGQLATNSIELVCHFMTNTKVHPADRLFQLRVNQSGSGCVPNNYKAQVDNYKQTRWNSEVVKNGYRQWLYQTCNEFGYYPTSEKKSSFKSDTAPLKYDTEFCTDVFGPRFNPNQLKKAVRNTNILYQGNDIKVKRVVFIHGSIDPWHALGRVKNPTAESPYILIQGTSHQYDMRTPVTSDSLELKNARILAERNIQKWLSM